MSLRFLCAGTRPEEQEPVYATSSPVIALEQLSAAAAAGGLGVKARSNLSAQRLGAGKAGCVLPSRILGCFSKLGTRFAWT